MKKIIYLILVLFSGVSYASDYTGIVTEIQINSVGNERVSVKVPSGTTTCGNSAFYYFENANSGKEKLFLSMLLTAYASGKTAYIRGNGLCDANQVEQVTDVHLK